MPGPTRLLGRGGLAVSLSAALALGTLVALGSAPALAADPETQALTRLDQDADGALTIRRDGSDAVEFVGVPASAEVDNPTVTSETGVAAAADRHLARYGAAIGADQTGTTLERTAVQTTLTGDVVRYQQQVDGVPVVGGDVVVGLREDGELSSVLAHTSDRTALPAATVSEAAATAQARAAFEKSAGRGGVATVESQGRWLLDASLIGGSARTPDRTVWRFEVTRGAGERRQIMVDDRTGAIVIDNDEIQHAAPRVVCDNANVGKADDVACTSGYTGGAASAVADVNTAFALSDVVSTFYQQIGGINLANLLGIATASGKRLASTVRWCYTDAACPYKNAFWNGKQMYYGAGYAGADDVVGHEITHGITERSSGLFYWGQSGAINESISDIMGEIVDQRYASANDAAKKWLIGEDIPGFANGLRNMANPAVAAFKDPDKMTSSYYVVETCEDPSNVKTCYPDNDGVHANSGVGNKTAYLISQGGTFNGQTIAGIDAGDATLTKSAKLWLLVDQSLSSGSDYADVATVLDQSCQALLARGTTGFTGTTCANVRKATVATELRLSPTNSPQPPNAPTTCPTGTTKRVLFNSETGNVTSKFVPSTGSWASSKWGRGKSLAHSGSTWGTGGATTVGSRSLVLRTGLRLPARQRTYLHFQQWRVLDFAGGKAFDAGTVEVDNTGDARGPVDVAGQPWVNGPKNTIYRGYGNPAAGRKGFGGDSRGYVASRVDLTAFAGATVKPRFTMNTDNAVAYVGWAVDDITVYTCDLPKLRASVPKVVGKAKVGKRLAARPGAWAPSGVKLSYRWLRNGKAIPKATKRAYKLAKADQGKRISVRVTGSKSGYAIKTVTSTRTAKVRKR